MTRIFPALNMMERQLPPLHHGRQPYWRPPVTHASTEVHTPSWNWHTTREVPEGLQLLTLDANGAYLGALGNVHVGHSQLERTGAYGGTLPTPRQIHPGYYKISVPYWSFSATIVHPLGDSPTLGTAKTIWIAHPTLILLLELLEEGHIGGFAIVDSYTSPIPVKFTKWADHLKGVRRDILDSRARLHADRPAPPKCDCDACDRYDAFKTGYSMAFSMMLTGEKCQTHRPDWAHAVYAEHAATQWRKAWRYTFTGLPLIRMGAVDEITIPAADLAEALARPKPPFRYDSSGRTIGAMKPKESYAYAGAPATASTPAYLGADDEDDIL